MHGLPPATASAFAAPEFTASLRHYHEALSRKWNVLAAAVAACLVAAVLYLGCTRSLYEATARLLLLQQGGRPLNVTRDDGVKNLERSEDFLPTQMAVLQSPRVVGRAIQSVGADRLPTLRSGSRGGSLQEMIQLAVKEYLKVTRPDRTASIVLVRYRARSDAEAVRFVDALLASYDEFIREHYQDNNTKIISLIGRARDDLGRELDGLQERYLAFQRENPLLLEDEAGRAVNNSRLTELDRASNEAMVKAMRLRSQLEIVKKLAKDGAEMWSVAYAIAQLGGDAGGTLLPRVAESEKGLSSDYLRQLLKEQQELLALYGPGYSKVKELQEQINGARDRARDSAGRLDQAEVGQLLSSIQQSLESVESLRDEIGGKLQGDLEKAKRDAIASTQGRRLREDLGRQRSLFDTIVDQLKQARFSGDFGGINSQTLEQANAPSKPVHPQSLVILLGAAVIGLVSGVGAALLADGLDSRVHTLDDLRKVPVSQVLGVIPRVSPDGIARAGHPGLISYSLPRSPSAEAYRVLRTNLEFLRRVRQVRVILITSAVAGEGKTTTASNLAISLALAGRRVLLIDADLRGPSLDGLYGCRPDLGLIQALRDGLPHTRVVQATPVDGLEIIAAGGEVANPAELLMSPRMPEFLDEVRPCYDYVIVDSSPLLPVTDPAVIGAAVDGVLLVLRASVTKCHELSRAAEVLRDVGTPTLGTVIAGSDDRFVGHRTGDATYGVPAPVPAPRYIPADLTSRPSTEVVRSFVLQVANDPAISSNLDGSSCRIAR
jgi:succinoglycan biosynthesis transport protein ExoP